MIQTWDIDDMGNTAATEDQILAMWKAAEGHVIRFARMLESFHGIGEIIERDCGGAHHATS